MRELKMCLYYDPAGENSHVTVKNCRNNDESNFTDTEEDMVKSIAVVCEYQGKLNVKLFLQYNSERKINVDPIDDFSDDAEFDNDDDEDYEDASESELNNSAEIDGSNAVF